MLWSIDNCSNRVSAEQCKSHDCIAGSGQSGVQLVYVTCIFKFSAGQLLVLNWSQALVHFFRINRTIAR